MAAEDDRADIGCFPQLQDIVCQRGATGVHFVATHGGGLFVFENLAVEHGGRRTHGRVFQRFDKAGKALVVKAAMNVSGKGLGFARGDLLSQRPCPGIGLDEIAEPVHQEAFHLLESPSKRGRLPQQANHAPGIVLRYARNCFG